MRGDYGGFDVDSIDTTYQFRSVAEYHFDWNKRSAKIFAGYRYVKPDVDNGDIAINVAIKGPLLGFGLRL